MLNLTQQFDLNKITTNITTKMRLI